MAERHPITDWQLERLALGELPPAQAQGLEARLAAEPEARARFEALRASDARILLEHPAARVVTEIERRAGTTRARRSGAPWREWRWPSAWLAAPTLAAATALLLWARPAATPGESLTRPADTVRLKGGPGLVAHLVLARGSEQLDDGAQARPGDVIQLSYRAAGKPYGAVLSLDGRGAVTLHLPEAPAGSTRLDPNGRVPLPHAYQLDDAPRFERFFLVTSNTPIELPALLEAARALARGPHADTTPLPVPPGAELTTLTLRKVSP